ncbi:hypothetical protein [Bacteroidetes bacterium endosymbiont of Geopemphigus sp.]|uniref:hypothetical protein n=1 Tax=Bacteroidetes bacterium endosymbiont of Geopemphigus sp. TaxID=2047937 RepID=UPI000CD15050|nr:hypothetical protein [Bacteroidetes bacterium endosymbiont of Geopemphigus sp.]
MPYCVKEHQTSFTDLSLHREVQVGFSFEKLSAYLFERMNEVIQPGTLSDKIWTRNKVDRLFGGSYEKDKAISVTQSYHEKSTL